MATIAIDTDKLLEIFKDIFTDGFYSAETYNDTIYNSVDSVWTDNYKKEILESVHLNAIERID